MRYGLKMTIDSAALGSITIKNLVFPEWWLLWPLPVCFALLAAEFVFRFDRLLHGRARPPRRSDLGRVTAMTWVEASLILFGGLVALMGLGAVGRVRLPRHQHRRRADVPRRRAGAVAARAQRRAVGDELFAHADSVLRADGRGAVPLRRRAEGDRRLRAADPPRAGPACR